NRIVCYSRVERSGTARENVNVVELFHISSPKTRQRKSRFLTSQTPFGMTIVGCFYADLDGVCDLYRMVEGDCLLCWLQIPQTSTNNCHPEDGFCPRDLLLILG